MDNDTEALNRLRLALGVAEPRTFTAHLWVTFMDGQQLRFENIVFSARRNDPADPVKIDGTTLTVEDDHQTFTILGVRYFSLEHL